MGEGILAALAQYAGRGEPDSNDGLVLRLRIDACDQEWQEDALTRRGFDETPHRVDLSLDKERF